MRKRWKVLAAGLALLPLTGLALLWLWPCVAAQKAALIREGMTLPEVEKVVGIKMHLSGSFAKTSHKTGMGCNWPMEDGSRLQVIFGPGKEGYPVIAVNTERFGLSLARHRRN